ncbi:Hypp7573 [Branchiostoma lanceolatum]|uniref:Hypp7573 protein n=1 Tax=Branchiostoma lanceolatum TaxID=7740 RepID=A0A8K0EED0_BRALA|nr:Hypp7573 [Branchiostoma lanceolatum]
MNLLMRSQASMIRSVVVESRGCSVKENMDPAVLRTETKQPESSHLHPYGGPGSYGNSWTCTRTNGSERHTGTGHGRTRAGFLGGSWTVVQRRETLVL